MKSGNGECKDVIFFRGEPADFWVACWLLAKDLTRQGRAGSSRQVVFQKPMRDEWDEWDEDDLLVIPAVVATSAPADWSGRLPREMSIGVAESQKTGVRLRCWMLVSESGGYHRIS